MLRHVRKTSRSITRGSILTLALILVHSFSAVAVLAMDVAAVRIGVGTARVDGVLEAQPYSLDATIEGHGLVDVRVTTPRGTELELIEVMPGFWSIELAGYTGLDDLRSSANVGFGEFVVSFLDPDGGSDSVILFFDPGDQDAFTEYGEILHPTDPQERTPLEPWFDWECSGICSDRLWDLRVLNGDGSWRFRSELSVETETWAPGPVRPYASYGFSCRSVGLLEEVEDRVTEGGDAFTYEPVFQSRNEIPFTALERIELDLNRTELTWSALSGELLYEVVVGDLRWLRDTDGNFAVNTEQCLANDLETTVLPHTVEPDPEESFWFLVRSAISPDGYESLVSTQVAERTEEIARSGAGCAGYSCPPEVPVFYDQPNEIAAGVCVEVAGVDGPPACPQAQYLRADGDIAVIKAAYPFTQAVEDGDGTTGAGQDWLKSPFNLLCYGFEMVPLSAHVFDELDDCYHATSDSLFGCSWVNPEFHWAVNVWSLIGLYSEQAARYGGSCEFDTMTGQLNPPGGFHAVNEGDGWWTWTVHATSECDYYGCRCDAVVSLWTAEGQPGEYWEDSLTNNSTPECTDSGFAF